MSALKVKQIQTKLRSMFESHLDLKDIGAHDLERDQKILSRCLAALVIYLQSGCSEKEAGEAVWDGGDDDGIDAAYFDAPTSRVIFTQTKFINKGIGEPEAKEIGAFVKGVRDAIEQDATAFGSRLAGKFADIALRIGTPGVKVHIVVASTGSSVLASHGAGILSDVLEELNGDDPQPFASFEIMGLTEVYDGLASDPAMGSMALDATILDWSLVSTPYPAYFGLIDGLQLKIWWKTFGRRVVAANIRHALGATEVNSEIQLTAQTTPEKFWYFNNGITLVAEEAQKAPAGAASRSAGVFEFRGASVVNGAQTISSLARVENDSALGIVKVPIRIILLKTAPAGFGDDVTRTNNLQNRVESRDFVAQDDEQKRLRKEMAIEGIDYQIERSEDTISSPNACELSEVTTALACAAADPSTAVQIKTGIGRIFADLKKAPYKTLFNPSVSGAKVFNAVVTFRVIELWIEEKKKSLKKSGPAWGVLIHGNRILASAVFSRYGASKLLSPIQDFKKDLVKSDIEVLCESVYVNMVSCVTNDYPGKFLATLFKNPTMSKAVFDAARSGITPKATVVSLSLFE
jgi:hypothetical protein